METPESQKQTLYSIKLTQKRHQGRKILPLPILTLQTKDKLNPQAHHVKKVKPIKQIARQNFKKVLDILSKSQKKSNCLPVNACGRTNKSKQMIQRRFKTNIDFYQTKIDFLLLRTEIFNQMKFIQIGNKNPPQDGQEFKFVKVSTPNLQRSLRFKKKSQKNQSEHLINFRKWENFCTAISYQNKLQTKIPNFKIKEKKARMTYLKRSLSTFDNTKKGEAINGWEDGPVRYATDYDHNDISDMYN